MRTTSRTLRYLLAVLLCVAAADGVWPRQAGPPSVVGPDAASVIMHVTVTEGVGGGYASGVDKSSFVVFDEKVPQEITLFQDGAVPASIGIVRSLNSNRGSTPAVYTPESRRVAAVRMASLFIPTSTPTR